MHSATYETISFIPVQVVTQSQGIGQFSHLFSFLGEFKDNLNRVCTHAQQVLSLASF